MKQILFIFILNLFNILSSNTDINSCIECHGEYFEKKAMGQSLIVKNMSKEEIYKSLNGYKNKSYGGNMKNIMVNQLKNISDIEYISNKIYNINHKIKNSIKTPIKNEQIELTNIEDFTERKLKCLEKTKKIINCMEIANNKKEMKNCIYKYQELSKKFNKLIKKGINNDKPNKN
jgi:hypothetical protein